MKLNVTSSIIPSPSLSTHFLCTHLAIESGDCSMIVNCTSEEWDVKPVDKIDRERCPLYGEWEACFYVKGSDEPRLRISLGDTKLEGGRMGADIFGMEGLSEAGAVTTIVNAVLWRLLQSPNYARTPSVILTDRYDWALWLIRLGLQQTVVKEGDFKISRFFDGIGVERTWNYGTGKGLTVKSTLVTHTQSSNCRHTQMFFANEHLYVKTHDFAIDPERYVNSLKQGPKPSRQAIPTLNMKTPQHICNQVVSIIQFFKSNGYNEELIYQFIDETNARTEAWLQHQAPDNRTMMMPGVGGLNHPMPLAQGVAPEIMQSFMGNIGNQPFGYNHMTPPPATSHMEQAKAVHPEQPGFAGKDY